ncbi:MAG: hypothetical protein Q9216_005046 [Gyalolechia sp. 2 TL-2023]
MFGEDWRGRKVSLLNRGLSPIKSRQAASNISHHYPSFPISQQRSTINLPPLEVFHHRRPRSVSHGSSSSSGTPPLVRPGSTSSQSDLTNSPMTPIYTHNELDLQNKPSPDFARSRYHAQMYETMAHAQRQSAPSQYLPSVDMTNGHMRNGLGALNQQALHNLQPPLTYPEPEPSMAALTSAADLQPTQYLQSTSIAPSQPQQQEQEKPTSQSAGTQTSSAPSPTSSTSPLPPKKKFPCPHASRFSCADTFTTSGHASRHGKKHTGEKSVICPTCKKAFTRKDNMKQHERTHKNAGAKHGQNSSATASPTSATQSEHAFQRASTPNGRDRSGSGKSEEEDGEGESPGLDALAAAANMR